MTTERLKLLVETVQKLSLARDLPTIMEVVRTNARKLTGADGATFILKDEDRCYYADEDAIGPLWKGQKFPLKACISGWAMIHRQPVVIEDIYVDDRIPIEAYAPTFVKSLAMVPIRTMDPIGAIGNYWSHQYKPSPEEVQLLQSLADIVSVSIENVRVYHELEQRVEQRTEQLNALNKELEAFSYSVSHDLRAPLRAISGFAKILQEDHGETMNDDAKHLTNNIIGSADKMNVLIRELLSFAQLGHKKISRKWIEMNELVDSVIADLQKSNDIKVDIEVRQLHDVQADYSLMYQVLFNLISNAIKYSSKKKNPRIEIASEKSGNEIIYSTKDNGCGFDMQYVDRLFGAFQRLHSQSQFEGTGVGLALVQRIINKHGGRVWAEAKENEGATFYFALRNNASMGNLLDGLAYKAQAAS